VTALEEVLDLTIFWEYRSILLVGILTNIKVWIWALLLAHGLGFTVCLMRISQMRLARIVGTAYAELFRNTPEYMLLIWVHFVFPILLSYSLHMKVNFSPLFSSVLALGLAYSGFLTETYRSGMLSVSRGHVEAGHALGMSDFQCITRIIMPQAVRRVLPELLNQAISLFKATTLVSLIAVPDLLYNVVIVTQEEMRPLPLYTGAAIVYCLIIFTASTVARQLSEKWRQRGWA